MALSFTTAVAQLGMPIAKLLLNKFFNEPAATVGGSLLDLAGAKLKSIEDQRIAARTFEDLSDRIVKRLLPAFSGAQDIVAEAVTVELGEVLSQAITAEFIIRNDLDVAKLSAELFAVRAESRRHFGASEDALYARALEEVVRFIVATAEALPEFQSRSAAAVLGRISRLGADIEKILDRVARIEAFAARAQDERTHRSARYEADYRQAVMRNLDYLELFGVDISAEAQRHALTVGYVSLNVASSASSVAAFSGDNVFVFLSKAKGRALIRGHAGSGKSTLMRWIAIAAASYEMPDVNPRQLALMLDAASGGDKSVSGELVASTDASYLRLKSLGTPFDRGRLQTILTKGISGVISATASDVAIAHAWMHTTLFGRHRVPFLVRLRECQGGKLPTPDDLPALIASEIGAPPEHWVRSVLEAGQGLLLLDGVDEIPNANRNQIRSAIEAIVQQFPDIWCVVTTRPTAVPDNWLARVGFTEASVSPMSDVDQSEFIRRWHAAIAEELKLQGRPSDTHQLAEDLILKLTEAPAIARVASNPLLCAVVCSLHRDRHRNLPESQSDLCEAMCHLLLHRREVEAGLSIAEFPVEYRLLSYMQKRTIILEIAHFMVRNELSSALDSDLVPVVDRTLRTFPTYAHQDARRSLIALVERSGVLREQPGGKVDFVHNTIKEFLAAEAFCRGGDVHLLALRAVDDAWRQVVLFAVAASNMAFATRIFQEMISLSQANMSARASHHYKLAAVYCRSAAVQLEPELIGKLKALERSLFPPKTFSEAEVLAAGGDHVVPLLRYTRMKARTAAACVRALRLIKSKLAARALDDYMIDDRQAVVSELALAVNPLKISVLRKAVLAGEVLDYRTLRQISDLGPLRGCAAGTIRLPGIRSMSLEPLTQIHGLQHLVLHNSSVQSFEELQNIRTLVRLDAMHSDVATLGLLSGLDNLTHLDLEGTRVQDISAVSRLKKLSMLDLSWTGIADISAVALSPDLISLNISSCKQLDASAMPRLPGLEYLNISALEHKAIDYLDGYSALVEIVMHGTIPDDISVLRRLPRLRALSGLSIDKKSLAVVCSLAGLKTLRVVAADAGALTDITSLLKLETLGIVDCNLNDLKSLSQSENLTTLIISSPIQSVAGIEKLRALKHLQIHRGALDGIEELRELKKLEYVTLPNLDMRAAQLLSDLPLLKRAFIFGSANHDAFSKLSQKIEVTVSGMMTQ